MKNKSPLITSALLALLGLLAPISPAQAQCQWGPDGDLAWQQLNTDSGLSIERGASSVSLGLYLFEASVRGHLLFALLDNADNLCMNGHSRDLHELGVGSVYSIPLRPGFSNLRFFEDNLTVHSPIVAYSSPNQTRNYLAYTDIGNPKRKAVQEHELQPGKWTFVGTPIDQGDKANELDDLVFKSVSGQQGPPPGTLVVRFVGGQYVSANFRSAFGYEAWSNSMKIERGDSFWVVIPSSVSENYSLSINGVHPSSDGVKNLSPGLNFIALTTPQPRTLSQLNLPAQAGDKVYVWHATGWKAANYRYAFGYQGWSTDLSIEPGQGMVYSRSGNSVNWLCPLGYTP